MTVAARPPRPTGGRRIWNDPDKCGYRPSVRAIRRFTVRPVLPPVLAAAGRPGGQPAVVLAPADPGRLRRGGPAGVGRRRPRPRAPPRRRRPGAAGPSSPSDDGFVQRLGAAKADLDAYLSARPLVPAQGRRRRTPRDRLLLPGVRHHRRAAAVLRRPRHPRRRPPQGRQRPRRPAGRRRPALQERATSSSRCRARAGSRRPTRSSTPTSCPCRCCARPTAPAPRSPSRCPAAPTCSPGSGSPRSAASRCCCSTPTSRATPTTTAR